MNDTALQSSPITLDRRLRLGETDYQVTAFPTDDHRIDLAIVSSDADGQVVSEISGGLAPTDLVGLTDVLASTLAGLIAMTQPALSTRSTPPPEHRGRHPNQGTRWSPEADELLVSRFRAGARPRDLIRELGRSHGGVRARLEFLGELAPGARWRSSPEPGPAPAPVPPAPPDGAARPPETALPPGSAPATATPTPAGTAGASAAEPPGHPVP